jgi:large subunit ribosomal protein L3
MITGVWGKKLGMTQIFAENNKVVPVTAIDMSNWFVTAIKTPERDGYAAIQVGRLRKRFEGQSFSNDWLSQPKKHFLWVREIKHESAADLTVGQAVSAEIILQVGNMVDVTGITIGHGFQGVVKRHDFGGGPDSHGSMFHRRPGTMSFMHSRGRVIKGKKLPGHMGCDQRVMKNLQVVKVASDLVLVKGSVPGKTGSLVYLATIKGS